MRCVVLQRNATKHSTTPSGMVIVGRRAIPPVDGDHFFDFGVVDVRDSLEIAGNVGTSVVQGQKIRIFTGQDGISAVDGNPVHVHSPAPRHGQSAPPSIVIEVHPHQPTRVPVVHVEVIGGDHGCHQKQNAQGHFHELDPQQLVPPGPGGVGGHQEAGRHHQHQGKDPEFPRPNAVHLKECHAVLEEAHEVLALEVEIGQTGRSHPRQMVDAGFLPETPDHEKHQRIPNDQVGLEPPDVKEPQRLVAVVEQPSDDDVDEADREKSPADEL
mmetsp:Transcript_9350/g.19611  ORF Transcript_9350/g.19611 Transcript_9350/m.19611 type:complete len:270 (+) Transcript_9350:159-968(+)